MKKADFPFRVMLCFLMVNISILQVAMAGIDKNEIKFRETGTFSDLVYAPGPSDLAGIEIRIVKINSSGDYQGTIQICEGEPTPLILVDVTIKGTAISFIIPENSIWAGNFIGQYTDKGIKGKLSFCDISKTPKIWEMELPRKKSYWD